MAFDGDTSQVDTIRYHTEEEIQKLLKVIDSKRNLAIFMLSYYHGLRVSEVGLIMEGDYDKEGKQLRIGRLKRGRIRTHDLRDNELKALNAWMAVRGKHGDDTPIFISQKGGAISRRTLDQLMKRYGKKAGLAEDKCYFHTLRHSCAVHMVNAEIPILEIRDWLGHRSVSSTLVYAAVSDKKFKQTAKKWHQHQDEAEGKKVGPKISWREDRKKKNA